MPLTTDTYYGKTLGELRTIEVSLIRFEVFFGRKLTTSEGLEALAKRPKEWAEKKEWKGFLYPVALTDVWGNDFVFRGHSASGEALLYSKGEDCLTSTKGNDPDDLNNWSPAHDGSYYTKKYEPWWSFIWKWIWDGP